LTVKQIYTGCLAQGSYFIESNGEAAVIDPLREVSQYIGLAKESNAKIKYIFETHFHADFISGHLTLAKKTGASIIFGPEAKPGYNCVIAHDNQVFKIGNISISVIHTPGHTMESSCYLLKDENKKDYCLFTGDTLFLGDVGRPDLAQKSLKLSKYFLAGLLYDSINNRIQPLSDDILIYPAHGAGSACGKNMMKQTVDTLGNQKIVNYALNGSLDRDDFIDELTNDLGKPPVYFPSNVKLNQNGYSDFDIVLEKNLNAISVEDFKALSIDKEDSVVLDVRNQDVFRLGFIPGSIFIGLNGEFAPWVGSILKDIHTKILVVCEKGQEVETITRLSRVGFDNVLGYLDGGFDSWKKSNEEIDYINSVSAYDLKEIINSDINLLDVRTKNERENGFLINTLNIPLNIFQSKIEVLDKSKKYYVHCAGGYRSMIACSILKRMGFDLLFDIKGGFAQIRKTELEIV